MRIKTHLSLILNSLFMFYININAQDMTSVNSGNLSDKTIVLVKKSTVKVDENYAHRMFEIDVTKAGKYFLSAWLMGAQNKNGDFYGYNLMVNEVKQNANVIPTRTNWQSV